MTLFTITVFFSNESVKLLHWRCLHHCFLFKRISKVTALTLFTITVFFSNESVKLLHWRCLHHCFLFKRISKVTALTLFTSLFSFQTNQWCYCIDVVYNTVFFSNESVKLPNWRCLHHCFLFKRISNVTALTLFTIRFSFQTNP